LLLCWYVLRCPAPAGQVHVPLAGPGEQRRGGDYVLQKLGPPVQGWLQKQTTEVRQSCGWDPSCRMIMLLDVS
jgi:hypothetical protein